MPALTQTRNIADFMVSEAPGYRSREEITMATATGGDILPGTVLGRITATGNHVRWAPTATDGSQNVAGLLWERLPSGQGGRRTIVARDAEVVASQIVYPATATNPQKASANAALVAAGIILR